MKDVTDKYKSSTHYLLSSLVPYTEANLSAVFLPRRFFSDLAKLDKKMSYEKIRNSYYYCLKKGYVIPDEITGQPIVTKLGLQKIKKLKGNKFKNEKLLIVFDIPESERFKRRQFRTLLRQLRFNQVQKSVWSSDYDSQKFIEAEVRRLKLKDSVRIFKSVEV